MLGSARAAGADACRRRGGRGAGGAAATGRRRWSRCGAALPVGAGCGGGGGGGGFGGGGGGNPGPYVLAGTYNVALVVDGKTVDTKPLRVMSDPEVVLTEAERKKLYDMAMEMHELQRRATEAGDRRGAAQPRAAGAGEGRWRAGPTSRPT